MPKDRVYNWDRATLQSRRRKLLTTTNLCFAPLELGGFCRMTFAEFEPVSPRSKLIHFWVVLDLPDLNP